MTENSTEALETFVNEALLCVAQHAAQQGKHKDAGLRD